MRGGGGSEKTLKSTCKQLREQGEVRLMTTMKSSLPKENSTEYSHVVKHPTINSLSDKTKDRGQVSPTGTNQISIYSLSDLGLSSYLLGWLSPSN